MPVLMYHSLAVDEEPGVRPYYRQTTQPDRFRQHMQLLADHGYCGVSLEQVLTSRREPPSTRRAVVITFDDGYADFAEHAWPVLQEFGFGATVYLPAKYIDETRRSFNGRDCLTSSEVRALHAQRVHFGSHTMSHPVLYGLPWSTIRSELLESRECLESLLGSKVTAFAYPFAFPQQDGGFVRTFTAVLAAAGYQSSVTTVVGRYRPGDNPFCIKRLPVNHCDDPALFLAKLQGAYDWVGLVQGTVKSLKASVSRALGARHANAEESCES